MRLAVLVALDGSNVGGADAWLRGALDRLDFQVADAMDEVPRCATVLVHVRGPVSQVESMRALSDAVAAREPESALFLVELTHDGPPDESLVAAEHVEGVREALGVRSRGYSALVAVSPEASEEPLAFTRLVVRAAEEAEDARSARLSEVVERLRVMPERHTAAQGYAHVRGAVDFELGASELPPFGALLELADGARDRQEWDHATAGYRAALLVARDAERRAAVHGRMGSVARAQGDVREARHAFEKARAASPSDRASLDALAAIASELGDWSRFASLSRERLPYLESRQEKVDLLFAIARTRAQELRDLNGAVRDLEEARQLEPARDDVLEALRRAYKVLGDWKKLSEVTGVLADIGPTEAERSARRFAQARIALDKLGDEQLGIAFLDAALTEDPTNDEALDVLVEVRTARGEVAQLGRALEELVERYRAMGDEERARDARRCLEALPTLAPPPALQLEPAADRTGPMAVLAAPVTLEELPPDSLIDDDELPPASDAITIGSIPAPAIEVAAAPKPVPEPEAAVDVPVFVAGETGLHAALAGPSLAELAAEIEPPPVSEDDGALLLELEEAVAKAPLDATTHARLFNLHTRAGRSDRAYLAALALEELGATQPEHEAVLDQCRPDGALRLRALLDGPAWESMRAPGSDDVVEALFGAVSPAAIAAQISDRRTRRRLVSLDPERRQAATSTVSIVASFRWAARILGVECPKLYLLDEVPGDIAAVPALEPSTALGPEVLHGRATKELAFLAAKHLAYYRREHHVLVHFSSLPELTLLVLACVQMEMPAVPIPQSVSERVAALRARIARHLAETDRVTMAAAVQRLESRGGRLDLGAWVRSVELTAARAGLFLCGDLRSAMAQIRAGATSIVTVDEARADLLAFTTSRAHAELRAEFALIAAPRSSGVRSRDELASTTGETAARAG